MVGHPIESHFGLLAKRDSGGSVTSVSVRTRENGVLPARHRARIVFLLFHLLERLEACEPIADGLFCLAGSDLITRSVDDEESLVSRESISLLRRLHRPACAHWRSCINRVIPSIIYGSSFVKKTGLLAFLNGGSKSIGRLSHVLLKPAAALPLSNDQSSPSSKGIGGNTSPAPVGTDAVVRGLMRFSGDGGIVSNIDMKNKMCEVILIEREQSSFASRSVAVSHPQGPVSGAVRDKLTVRALRSPLDDVVHAPLYLDDSVPAGDLVEAMLESSVDSLLSAAIPLGEVERKSGFEKSEDDESLVEQTEKSDEADD